jgi:hypothetical protein
VDVLEVKGGPMTKGELSPALQSLGWSPLAVELGIKHEFRRVYCGHDFLARIEDYDCWTTDHITPKSEDGEREDTNTIVRI